MSKNLNTKWFVLYLDFSEKKFCFIGQVTGSLRRAIINRQWQPEVSGTVQTSCSRPSSCSRPHDEPRAAPLKEDFFLETSINHCHGDEAAVHPSVAGL